MSSNSNCIYRIYYQYFDAKGNIIRYASKYEKLLIYPIVSLLVNALLDFIEKGF